MFTTLDFAHINRMQIGFFRQFFLTQSGLIAMLPDSYPEGFEFLFLLRVRHSFSAEQDGPEK